jgi:alkanesulfonate monooxygenase SsuD/methylene tetrahydromethanopterin reductase-like flavin-dependent oxidoreductase (luciferase family)
MRFYCNLNDCRVQPAQMGRAREAEGWHGILVADHMWDAAGTRPHVWSVLGALAASTTELVVGTGFGNNLFRHPVEFAQASLTMQRISGGRFEGGLGAGWAEEEIVGTGRALAPPSERAGRLIEAVRLIRELFDTGSCSYTGRYYQVDVPRLERLGDMAPPPLVVGAVGRRVITSVAPYIDKLELMPAAVATRGGSVDMAVSNSITRDDIRAMVDFARSTRDDLPLRLYIPCCAGDDERTKKIAAMFDGFFAEFQGSPPKVADAIHRLGDLGLAELHVSPTDQYTFENLAPLLLAPTAA